RFSSRTWSAYCASVPARPTTRRCKSSATMTGGGCAACDPFHAVRAILRAMTGIIRFHETGGPDVLRWESTEVGEPGRDEVRLRQTAVGLNFIDVYERNGLYQVPLPGTPGKEAAGVVDAVGARVKHLQVGDRVAYSSSGSGAYAQARVLPADRLVKIPDNIDDNTAAAAMLKGLTAQALLRQVYKVRKSDALLVHAAAGGVGSILVQWARHLGATVIAVVGS